MKTVFSLLAIVLATDVMFRAELGLFHLVSDRTEQVMAIATD